MKIAYINFLNHCYVDTEVEMKEIYTSNHMWKLFENFLVDICRVSIVASLLTQNTPKKNQALSSVAPMIAGVQQHERAQARRHHSGALRD